MIYTDTSKIDDLKSIKELYENETETFDSDFYITIQPLLEKFKIKYLSINRLSMEADDIRHIGMAIEEEYREDKTFYNNKDDLLKYTSLIFMRNIWEINRKFELLNEDYEFKYGKIIEDNKNKNVDIDDTENKTETLEHDETNTETDIKDIDENISNDEQANNQVDEFEKPQFSDIEKSISSRVKEKIDRLQTNVITRDENNTRTNTIDKDTTNTRQGTNTRDIIETVNGTLTEKNLNDLEDLNKYFASYMHYNLLEIAKLFKNCFVHIFNI